VGKTTLATRWKSRPELRFKLNETIIQFVNKIKISWRFSR